MDNILQKLFDAADHHGADTGEPDHTVGDLQDLLRAACALMTPAQKREFLEGETVARVVDAGGYDFEVSDLLNDLDEAEKQ